MSLPPDLRSGSKLPRRVALPAVSPAFSLPLSAVAQPQEVLQPQPGPDSPLPHLQSPSLPVMCAEIAAVLCHTPQTA